MKKFSELSNNDKKVEESTNKQDFILNLVEESLTVVDGEIQGKDVLVKTLNKIIEMNDSKTKIDVLESVRVNAYRGGFDFNLISNAIETEKQKLDNPVEEEVEEERDIFFAQPNDKIVSMSESVKTDDVETEEVVEEEVIEEEVEEVIEESVEESKKGEEDCDEEDCDEEDCDEEDCDEEDLVEESVDETEEVVEETEEVVEETEEVVEETEEVVEESVEESNDSAVEEVSLIITSEMQDISNLASLCESIIDGDVLKIKKEKIEIILDKSNLDKEEGLKKKVELENMSDDELETAYSECEEECK